MTNSAEADKKKTGLVDRLKNNVIVVVFSFCAMTATATAGGVAYVANLVAQADKSAALKEQADQLGMDHARALTEKEDVIDEAQHRLSELHASMVPHDLDENRDEFLEKQFATGERLEELHGNRDLVEVLGDNVMVSANANRDGIYPIEAASSFQLMTDASFDPAAIDAPTEHTRVWVVGDRVEVSNHNRIVTLVPHFVISRVPVVKLDLESFEHPLMHVIALNDAWHRAQRDRLNVVSQYRNIKTLLQQNYLLYSRARLRQVGLGNEDSEKTIYLHDLAVFFYGSSDEVEFLYSVRAVFMSDSTDFIDEPAWMRIREGLEMLVFNPITGGLELGTEGD